MVTTLADYLLPTATEVPNFEIIHCEYPSTLNPMGVKGIGEAGTIPAAAAVIAAVAVPHEDVGLQLRKVVQKVQA